MRASSFASGQEKGPLIIGAPTSIFYRKVTALSPASNQVPALKIANQLSYGNSNYSYNGEPAPNFYGYSGVGIGPQNARTEAEIKQWTFAVFVVPGNQPTQKVTFVNEGREPRAPGASSNLQSYFEAVPMPEIGKVPSGRLNPETGTDQYLCVWQPNTNKMWEMWRLREEGGEYSFQYGGFIEDLKQMGWHCATWVGSYGDRPFPAGRDNYTPGPCGSTDGQAHQTRPSLQFPQYDCGRTGSSCRSP